MVAMACTMLAEKARNGIFIEQAPLQSARFEQHALKVIELRSRQPICPRGGETHLLATDDGMRQQVLDGRFQNRLASKTLNGVFGGNRGGELDPTMDEERHPDVDR